VPWRVTVAVATAESRQVRDAASPAKPCRDGPLRATRRVSTRLFGITKPHSSKPRRVIPQRLRRARAALFRGSLKLGVEVCTDPAARQQRQVTFRRMLRKPTLQIDGATGEVFGEIAAAILQSGATHRHRTQDLWLAAQAIQHDLHLLTRNRRDFRDVPGLRLSLIG